jgi:hypothetical protein
VDGGVVSAAQIIQDLCMVSETVNAIAERLARVRWSAAPEWDRSAADLLHEYYRRLLPFWPDDRFKIQPDNAEVVDALLGRLAPPERAWVQERADALAASRVSQRLAAVILAGAILVSRGELEPESDPGVPMLDLFEAGFELAPTHGGVDVMHGAGMRTVPLPARALERDRQAAPPSSRCAAVP